MNQIIITNCLSAIEPIGGRDVSAVWLILTHETNVKPDHISQILNLCPWLILISGVGAESVHDQIDEAILDRNMENSPVTTWYEIVDLDDAINDFETLELSPSRQGMKVIVAPNLDRRMLAVIYDLIKT